MERMSDRHEGDLGGRLPSFENRREVVVRLIVDPDVASRPAIQHTAWMTTNLLARADRIVTRILLDCPEVPLMDRVVPFGTSTTLASRLHEAANLIDVPRVILNAELPADRTIRIAASPRAETDLSVLGAGWWGGVAIDGALSDWSDADLDSAVPFGPYMAATFAAGDVFLRARGANSASTATYGWDCWSHTPAATPSRPPEPAVDLSFAALAGVGAVGAAWMHALWAYPHATGTVNIVDADPRGVDLTNLNRGVLFTAADIGLPKTRVAAAATPGELRWIPLEGHYEEQALDPQVLISAVDTNGARDALQATYRARVLGGSTHDLRAEVFRSGVPGIGACLRCYNPPRPKASDLDIQRRALEHDDVVRQVAGELGIAEEAASAWLREPACGQLSDDFMKRLREDLDGGDPREFSVGFVSVAAGVMLAAETVKLACGQDEPEAASISVRLQFLDPTRQSGRYLEQRDRDCPKCDPPSPVMNVWEQRYSGFSAPNLDSTKGSLT